jgi:hypothetical protein
MLEPIQAMHAFCPQSKLYFSVTPLFGAHE